MALLVSSLDTLPQLMLRSSVASSMSGIESGGGLFDGSLGLLFGYPTTINVKVFSCFFNVWD